MRAHDGYLFDDFGKQVRFQESPNFRGSLAAPAFIILHYTAGHSFHQSCDWLCNPAAKASAHLVIGNEGELAQLVKFSLRAWHAGVSEWPPTPRGLPTKPDHVSGLNAHAIGIELDNYGPVQLRGDGTYRFHDTEVRAGDVVRADHKHGGPHKYWNTYPEVQVLAAYAVCKALLAAYPSIKHVLGHDDIAPRRKYDPGAAFPMIAFRSWLFGRSEE